MALTALQEWPRETWPDTAAERIADIAAFDPNQQTQELASGIHIGP